MSLPHLSLATPGPQDLQPLVGDLALRRGRVHEFCGPARIRLAVQVMARSTGPVVWVRPAWGSDRLNAAGLQPLADPARLMFASATREEGLLWAMEETLRSGVVPLVVAELTTPPGLTPVRRLHLAAEAGAVAAGGAPAPLGLILIPGQGGAPGVESRWHMTPAPSRSLLRVAGQSWSLSRLRARLAPPARWLMHSAPSAAAEVLEPLPP